MDEQTKRLIADIDETLSLMTQGEYQWWQSAPGVGRKEYIDAITEKTLAHPEQNERVHSVGIMQNGGEITIAVTGFGPKSHANARGITLCLNAIPWLLNTIREVVADRDKVANRYKNLTTLCKQLEMGGVDIKTLNALIDRTDD